MINLYENNDLSFDFEQYLQHIDKANLTEENKREVCKSFLQGSCKLGNKCPFRHVKPEKAVVCKHWLRGLCKKGDKCEFLHEYDPKKMPECFFYSKFGECSNPECPFLHISAEDKKKPCPWYNRGFCKHGKNCMLRHTKKVACPDYLAGFCFKGPNCKFAHPKFEIDMSKMSIIGMGGFQKQDYSAKRQNQFNNFAKQPVEEYKPTYDVRGNLIDASDSIEQSPQQQQQLQQQLQQQMDPNKKFRALHDVTCYKCQGKGHYANKCPMSLKFQPHLQLLSAHSE